VRKCVNSEPCGDLLIFTVTSALLLAAAFAATYLPSRRAARLGPILVLRKE